MRWREFLADTKIKFDRGNALASLFKSLIIFAAGIKIIFPNMSYIQLIWFTAGVAVAVYIAGLVDLKLLKIFQAELKLTTGRYNPYFVELRKSVKKSKI